MKKIPILLHVRIRATIEKFKNKYRIDSSRLPGWDYSHKIVEYMSDNPSNWREDTLMWKMNENNPFFDMSSINIDPGK